MITSIETTVFRPNMLVPQLVQKVHVVHCIHPEYHIEPTALHVRISIVILL
jgi:hypothetical protein